MHSDRADRALWIREGPARGVGVPAGDHAIYPVSPAEIMELIACDTPRSGFARGPTLAALIADEPHRAFVAVHRGTGAFSGLAIGQKDGIAVLVADTPIAAAWLLHAAERAGTPGRAIVPEWNKDAIALFHDAGYRRAEARPSTGAPQGRPETQYALLE